MTLHSQRSGRRHHTPRTQHGIALVEIAIALPALLVLLMVTAEFTRVFYQYNTLTKTVRDGARYIAQNSLSGNLPVEVPASVINNTKNLVVSGNTSGGNAVLPGLTDDDISIDFSSVTDTGLPRYYVTVTANYSYDPLLPLLDGIGFLSSNQDTQFELTALSSMRSQ